MSYLRALMQLQLADVLYARGEHTKAISTATTGLRTLQAAIDNDSNNKNKKTMLGFAIDKYDRIKSKMPLSHQEKYDLQTSRVFDFLLLPFPAVGLPDIDNWEENPWIDSSYPPQDGWQRLNDNEELKNKNPDLKMLINEEVIRQSNQNNCSLICSLISLHKLSESNLTDLIYPKNKDGMPVYTPSGRYIVRIRLGGTHRMVEVDDYFPFEERIVVKTKFGSIAPLIIEKAYLKTFGGYNFEGSNAALDTYRLSGAIPVVEDLQKKHFVNPDSNLDPLQDLMRNDIGRWSLLCLGTGPNPTLGLQRNHDFVVTKVENKETLLVLNPWHREPVEYKWEQVPKLFKILYINVRRDRFVFHKNFVQILPVEHTLNFFGLICNLPQLKVANTSNQPVEGFITVALSPGASKLSAKTQIKAFSASNSLITDGEAPIMKETPEIDSQCLSLYLVLEPHAQAVVVMIIKDAVTELSSVGINVELNFNAAIDAEKLPVPTNKTTLRGEWAVIAGALGSPRYFVNPQFVLQIHQPCDVVEVFLCAQSNACQVAAFVYDKRGNVKPKTSDMITNSGKYAVGFQYMRLHNVQVGEYLIIPSLFEQQRAHFLIGVRCDAPYKFERKSSAISGYFEQKVRIERGPSSLVTITLKTTQIQPIRIILLVSGNCEIDDAETEFTFKGEKSLQLKWNYGKFMAIDVFSSAPVTVLTT